MGWEHEILIMPTAEIITIGTELLLGETIDTNTRYIAHLLRDLGVNLYRTSTVGDNQERIAQIIREGMSRSQIIITTGGLGPTIDDTTRKAIAKALDVETEFREELWEQIKERFQRYGRLPTENNKRQANIPVGSIAIRNPVGTAPAFIFETENHAIISLPGVPREMEYLMENAILPYLRERFNLRGVIKTRILHTVGVGESIIDDRIDDLERLSNPSVGLSAQAGQVDIRITAKADSESQADAFIRPVEEAIQHRLGNWIYGADDVTLEDIAMRHLSSRGWSLIVIESGLDRKLIQRLANTDGPLAGAEILITHPTSEELIDRVHQSLLSYRAQVGLGLTLQSGEGAMILNIALITPHGDDLSIQSYGGPPQLAPHWAINLSLNILRGI